MIASIREKPYKAPFTIDGSFGLLKLRVVAYFENETFAEDEILVRTFKVDQQEQINLVAVKASVFRSDDGGDLTADDFEVKENKEKKTIAHFRKDEAPLRVAIVMDSSISMFGEKLYRAQYALKTFMSKLQPEDRVSIYSFDSKVLKLVDFTNDFKGALPKLMTLSPQWATSLYDSMLIAHDALMGQNGTKVLIVISDGSDTFSAVNDIHVAQVLRNSPVLVYSIILPGGAFRDEGQGTRFLREMARLSGSVSTQIRNLNKIDETLERIYQDLKSMYYLDFYTDIANPANRKVKVDVKRKGAKVRSRTMN